MNRLIAFLIVSALSGTLFAADSTAVTEAGKRRNEVQQELNKANNTLSALTGRLRVQFEARPEWTAAAAAERQAKRDYDTAREAVLASVRATPEYKKLQDELKAAEEELAKLKEQKADQAEIFKVATKTVELRGTISKMEFEAVNNDPKVAETRKTLADATAALNELKKQFDEICKANTEWAAAKKVVDDIQIKLAEADKQLADARKAHSQQVASENKSKAESRRSSRSSSGSRRVGGGY